MENYTNTLVEEYQSCAGIYTDQQKADAAKAFSEHAKEGWLDLESFHMAYDDVLEEENLLDGNFAEDGNLKGKFTYGACKDKNTPGKIAMLKLWEYNYSKGGTIYKNGRMIDIKSKVLKSKDRYLKDKEEEEFNKYLKDTEASMTKILNQKLDSLVKEHIDLGIKIYGEARAERIQSDFTIDVNVYPYESKVGSYAVTSSTHVANLNYDTAQNHVLCHSIKADKAEDDIRDVFKEVYYRTKDELTKIVQDEKDLYARYKVIKDLCDKYKYRLSKLEILYCRVKSTNQIIYIDTEKEPKLVEVDTKMPVTVTDVNDLEPVATKYSIQSTGRCYTDDNSYYSWNSKALTDAEAKQLGMYSDEAEGKKVRADYWGASYNLSTGSDNHYSHLPGFDTWAHWEYECDSSD